MQAITMSNLNKEALNKKEDQKAKFKIKPEYLRYIKAIDKIISIKSFKKPKIKLSSLELKTNCNISLVDYIERILDYSEIEKNTFIYSLNLLEIINKKHNCINNKNIYKFLLIGVVCSVKYLEDYVYENNFYSEVGGVDLSVLNQMEMEFLKILDFNIHINERDFHFFKEKNNFK